MNTKKWTDVFFENLGPKIVCLCLAILLFVYNRVSSLDHKTFTVPLKVEANGLMMPYSDVPRYIKIHVRSSAENVSTISAASFTAVLNLDNYTDAGSYSVPVTVTTAQNLMLLDTLEYSCHPEIINVDLDERIVRYVPVTPVYSGTVTHGYEISGVDVNPATVKVAGPSRILNKVKYINTRKVNVNGASTSLMQEVKLDNMNPKLDVLPESDYKVTVAITPAQGEKKIENLEPFCSGLSDTLQVQDKISNVSFTVSGTVPVLDEFEPDEKTVILDLSAIFDPGTYEVPVNINIPSTITLVEKSKDTVTVIISSRVVESEDFAEGISRENSENPVEKAEVKAAEKTADKSVEKSEIKTAEEKSANTEKADDEEKTAQ